MKGTKTTTRSPRAKKPDDMGVYREVYPGITAPQDTGTSGNVKISGLARRRNRGIYTLAGLAVVGAAGLVGYISDQTSRNPRYQSGASANYSPLPPMSEAFTTYVAGYQALNDEFKRSSGVEMTEEPVPPEIPVNGPGTGAYGLDINDDGIKELYVIEGCGVSTCWGKLYKNENGTFRAILDDLVGPISPENVNGYRNIFRTKRVDLPGGKFTEKIIKYSWDGQQYREVKRFLRSEDVQLTSEIIGASFAQASPEQRRDTLSELEKLFGTHSALMIFANVSSGGMIPKGMEMEYLREYSREKGKDFLNGYANDPEGFERMLFGNITNSVALTSGDPRGYLIDGARAALMSVARDFKQDTYSKHVERMNRIEQGSGWINAFRSRTGRDPTPQEFMTLYAQGASGAIREDQLRTSSPTYVNERRSGSAAGETVTREVPLDSPGDPRYGTPQPNYGRPQQDFNQNMQKAQDDARRAAGQAIQGAGRAAGPTIDALKKILPTPTPQRGRGGGGKQN